MNDLEALENLAKFLEDYAALKASQQSLLKQRIQLNAIATNPDWILAPDGMTSDQHIAAGGRFIDLGGAVRDSIQSDKHEMWMLVTPNPLKDRLAETEELLQQMAAQNLRHCEELDALKTSHTALIKAVDGCREFRTRRICDEAERALATAKKLEESR